MGAASSSRAGESRYGAVFFLALLLLVFEIVAPGASWARAVGVGLEVAALFVVVATARQPAEVRRLRALVVAGAGLAVVALIAAGVLSREAAFGLGGLLALVIPAALLGGVGRLIRQRGVTLQAILGALAIYLFVGLVFAWAIAFVSEIASQPYFTQGRVSQGDRVYFSFTVLTTTGFGDLTAATSVGHALAVVEMLIGQLYLVTVIGVLVGNLRRRE